MKPIISLILFIMAISCGIAQNSPVAINDSTDIHLGEWVTINVVKNDYHPDGLSFKVAQAGGVSYTDSTITYFLDFDEYYNQFGTLSRGYTLEDENGNFGLESHGEVKLNLINHFCDTLDGNNIKAPVNPWGSQFWRGPGRNPSTYEPYPCFFEYPKGSGKHTIFTSTLWIGGIDQDEQLRLSGERYRQNGIDFWAGPLSVEGDSLSIDTATVIKWHRVWKLSKEEVEYHVKNWNKLDYVPIENIANWPAHGDPGLNQNQYLAPFIDVDGNGIYNPLLGDYPLIKGDQCVFFIFNDLRNEHSETGGEHIGLEIHAMMYQFDRPDNIALNNTVFLNYKIFNRSSYSLSDTYVGIYTDIDLGWSQDDYVGCDVGRGMYFGYNGDDMDGNGEPRAYGENPPAQGTLFLGGPKLDADNIDNSSGGCDESINGVGFGDGVVDNERLGMTGFLYHNNGGTIQCAPLFSNEYYSYLQGIWLDGSRVDYGGNGHPSAHSYGPACRFMYPGLSDPCLWGTDGVEPNGPIDWREENSWNGSPNPPADRRGVGSSGPFTFLPHSVQSIDIAYVTARGEDGPLSSVELLKVYVDSIRALYVQNSDDFGTQYLGVEETAQPNQSLKFFPNPAGDKITIENTYASQKSVYSIYDMYGSIVITGHVNSQGQTTLDIGELEKGLYLIQVTDDLHRQTGKIVKR